MSGRAPRRPPRSARRVATVGLGTKEIKLLLEWLGANGLRHYVPEHEPIYVTPRWLYLDTLYVRDDGGPMPGHRADGYLLTADRTDMRRKPRVLQHHVPLRAVAPGLATRFGV